MPWKATAVVVAPTDEDVTYSSGIAATRLEAVNELGSILAAVVGKSIKSVRITETVDAAGMILLAYTLSSAIAQYEDADLVFERVDATLGLVAKTRFVENMNLSKKLVGRPEVNLADLGILDIQTNYRDGNGVGGYTLSAASKFRI